MPNLMRRFYWTVFLAVNLIGQARYPYRPAQRIAHDCDGNVRRMVRYAYRWVPHYRETMDGLGLTPADIQTFDDLRKLPLISVDDLQRDSGAFRSTACRADELMTLASSGSTGSPHTIWHDLGSVYTNSADGERERRMLQRTIGRGTKYRSMSFGSLTGHKYLVQRAARAGALWPHWLNLRQTRVAEREGLEHMAERMNAVRPDLVSGFGSALAELFLHLDAKGEPFHRPRIVRYGSDALPEAVRHMLVDKYSIQVFSTYQSIEALKLGWECEAHLGYHINADHYPTRIVDAEGRDVPPGEMGEVVISNLVNRGTVLLNYRMGDWARRIEEPCPCGRTLPRISFVDGRIVDALLALDGHRVPCTLLDRAIRPHPGVWQWQAVQEARDRLSIALRVAASCDREALEQAVVAAAKDGLGEGMAVELRFVDEIARTPAGKVRYVINEVEARP